MRKNESSFKEGTNLGHTLQYFALVYKQAMLSDNRSETEL